MRLPNSRNRRDTGENSAMTPMIDVVFLLLIFFVCAAAGVYRESLLPADLGSGAIVAADAIEPRERPFGEVWLFLSRDNGQTVVQVNAGGERFVDLTDLRQRLLQLAEATTEIPVILDIKPAVPLGDLISVYDACYEANFASIQFATDPPRPE